MAWTKFQVGLALLLVVTGSINTLSTKWADILKAVNSGGEEVEFSHPFLQALSMFLGEMMCLLTFKIVFRIFTRRRDGSVDTHTLTRGTRVFNPFILMIPAMCDMVATSVMYIGLKLTYVSSFQMFRGSVIIFVGVLSIIFLGRRLKWREWIGIIIVILGLALVGVSDFINSPSGGYSTSNIILGDGLIVLAQIITSIQMVVEEKYVSGLDIPALQAVGWEGIFGFVVLGLLQIPFYWIPVDKRFANNPRLVLEDIPDGFVQMYNNPLLIVSVLGTVISIAFFNFAGISVTKEISATTRMVLDSVRTVVVWVFSLAFFGQSFEWLQLLGFIILLFGMCLYNNILQFQKWISAIRNRRQYGDMQEEQVENYKADEVGGPSSS